MAGSISTWGTGQYIAGRDHWAYLPKRYKLDNTARGIIFCHSASANYKAIFPGTATLNLMRLYRALAAAGFVVLSIDYGANTYMNDSAMTRMDAAKTYLTGTLKAKTDKVIVAGNSMGQGTAIAWAYRNPTLTQGIVGTLGFSDGQAIYDANPSLATDMDAAYSPSNWATEKSTRDPAILAPASAPLRALPFRAFYAPDDAVVLPATVESLVTAWGANAQRFQLGTGGHTDTPLAAVRSSEWVDIFKALG